jgi:hypothetical protein
MLGYSSPIWNLSIAAIGKSIESAEVAALVYALSSKPFKSATPNSSGSYIVSKKLGVEVSANMTIHNRDYWPPRKNGRLWCTYVSTVGLMPNFVEGLPFGIKEHFKIDDFKNIATIETRRLGTIARFADIRPNVELIAYFDDDEFAYITTSWGEPVNMQHYVEDGFFGTWCALNGLLVEKYDATMLADWKSRSKTPLQFVNEACGGLLWSSDVQSKYHAFFDAYHSGFCMPEAFTWNGAMKAIFNGSNYFRNENEKMTEDSWTNYDKIASTIDAKFALWQAGKFPSIDG